MQRKSCVISLSKHDNSSLIVESVKLKDALCYTVINDLAVKHDLMDDCNVMHHIELLVKDGLPIDDFVPELLKVSKGKIIDDMLHLMARFCACEKKIAKLEMKLNMSMSSDECMIFRLGSVNDPISYKSSDALPCNSCDSLLSKNKNLNVAIADLKSELDIVKSYASMPCDICVALHNDLDTARDEISLMKSNAFLPCGSCESLLAEIDNLKLAHTTCVNELEHARAEICEMKSCLAACALWFSMMVLALLLVIIMIPCLM
jgi:hypothetical protein